MNLNDGHTKAILLSQFLPRNPKHDKDSTRNQGFMLKAGHHTRFKNASVDI